MNELGKLALFSVLLNLLLLSCIVGYVVARITIRAREKRAGR